MPIVPVGVPVHAVAPIIAPLIIPIPMMPVYIPPMVAPPVEFGYTYQEMTAEAYLALGLSPAEFVFLLETSIETKKMLADLEIPIYGPDIKAVNDPEYGDPKANFEQA